MSSTGKPEVQGSGLDFASLPPPCKPDDLDDLDDLDGLDGLEGLDMDLSPHLHLVDLPLLEEEPDSEGCQSLMSWAVNLRTLSTSSLTPRIHDVPPGTLIAPDGRSHWLQVLRMHDFCKDTAQ